MKLAKTFVTTMIFLMFFNIFILFKPDHGISNLSSFISLKNDPLYVVVAITDVTHRLISWKSCIKHSFFYMSVSKVAKAVTSKFFS